MHNSGLNQGRKKRMQEFVCMHFFLIWTDISDILYREINLSKGGNRDGGQDL
jgi:hypothetical protein